MVDHFSTYIYQKRGFFYFSRRVPKEVQQCHSKQRIVLALNTRSRAKALKYSQVIGMGFAIGVEPYIHYPSHTSPDSVIGCEDNFRVGK